MILHFSYGYYFKTNLQLKESDRKKLDSERALVRLKEEFQKSVLFYFAQIQLLKEASWCFFLETDMFFNFLMYASSRHLNQFLKVG